MLTMAAISLTDYLNEVNIIYIITAIFDAKIDNITTTCLVRTARINMLTVAGR
jgi:hypothetical protein